MKTFTLYLGVAVLILSAVQADDHKYPKATDVKPDHDCSCNGYEVLATKCKEDWPAEIKKCNATSVAYANYKFWCEKLNKFREEKKEGERPNLAARKMTCDAYKSLAERYKEKCGLKVQPTKQKRYLPVGRVPDNSPILPSVDWSSKMTPIKDQDECGSCWAFASNAMCEYYLSGKYKRTIILSEQSLIDCDTSNSACDGGWPTKSLDFMSTKGVADGTRYQYQNSRGFCRSPLLYATYARCPKAIAENNPNGNDNRLRQVLSKTPVIGAMNVVPGLYQHSKGIHSPLSCPANINHAIMIVGYGTENGVKYWIIRNSWGTQWGEKGYFKLNADTLNNCGISLWYWYY